MLGWGITILILVLVTWVYSVYLSWREAIGRTPTLITEVQFLTLYARIERIARRGWYRLTMQTRKASTWSGKQAKHLLVKVFPAAAPAFTKHDELTGLAQGPSSYFLKTISSRTSKASRSTRSKKML